MPNWHREEEKPSSKRVKASDPTGVEDTFGRIIKVGDWVAYPQVSCGKARTAVGRVVSIRQVPTPKNRSHQPWLAGPAFGVMPAPGEALTGVQTLSPHQSRHAVRAPARWKPAPDREYR